VDALIATFACVGSCDPALVARAIRRAAVKAERSTGLAKPTLLSLMGVSGAIPVGPVAQRDRVHTHRTFPSYRFPESAALALSKVVDYAHSRRQPPGRIPTYECPDLGQTRLWVEQLVEELTAGSPLVLSPTQNQELMKSFGVPISDTPPEHPARKDLLVSMSLSADPDFGPIWRLHRPGEEPLLRLTPLTDLDIADVLGRLRVPPDCGLAETLGRLTQLVEELPWICALDAEIALPPEPSAAPHPGPLALQPSLGVALSQAEYHQL
jgi:hypothetical protein